MAAVLTAGIGSFVHTHVHRNASDSLPIYWPYFVREPSGPIARGQLVEACPPVAAAQLAQARGYVGDGPCSGGAVYLKLVAAAAGDRVTVGAQGVSVNGRRLPDSAQVSRDSRGRTLGGLHGVFRLSAGQLWLYGTAAKSYDSRYFGAVSSSAVRAIAWAPGAILPDLSGR